MQTEASVICETQNTIIDETEVLKAIDQNKNHKMRHIYLTMEHFMAVRY